MDSERDPVGVGGWLAFFLFTLGVVSPLAAIGGTAVNLYSDPSLGAFFGTDWTAMQAAEWTIVGLVCAMAWYMVWRLLKVREWRSVRIVIAGIWAIGIGSVAAEVIAVWLIAGIPFGVLLAEAGPELIRPVIYCTIWTAYLLNSERVANTYARNAGEAEMVDTFA